MYFEKQYLSENIDCDFSNNLKLSSAMKYMQQTAGDQLANDGYSVEKLFEEKMAFLLTKICLKINRMPKNAECVVTGTAPTETRGVRFVRELAIDSLEGERLIYASSFWVLANTDTHKIMRPKQFPYDFQFQPPEFSDIIDDLKIPAQEGELVNEDERLIRYSDIDINEHVNNAVYGDFVCDMLPFEEFTSRGIDSCVIHFQSEAMLGDSLKMKSAKLNESEYRVTGEHSRSACFDSWVRLK